MLSLTLFTLLLHPFLLLAQNRSVPVHRGFTLPLQRTSVIQPFDGIKPEILESQAPISNVQRYTYLVKIQVGGQDFWVTLDTGSSDLWILSNNCSSSETDGVAKYSPSSTGSLLPDVPFELDYLLGSVTGCVAFDTVALGPYQLSSQIFGLANHTNNLGISGNHNSGILGLAFPSAVSIVNNTAVSPLANIFSYLPDSLRFFALKLGRDEGHLVDPTSSFSVGQLDPAFAKDFSNFAFYPVSSAGADEYNYWKLPLVSLTINSTDIPLSPSLVPGSRRPIAVLDTGTTLILGPIVDVETFWNTVNSNGNIARKNPVTDLWEVRCEKAIIASFVFGEGAYRKAFVLHPEDVNWAINGTDGSWCMGGIQGNGGVNSGDWLLGDVFLRNVYASHHGKNSTHDPVIGLASTTDVATALYEFRQGRAPDMTPSMSIQIHGQVQHSNPFWATIVYSVSSMCGFLGGMVLTVLFRLQHQKTTRKYS
ncbi:aspartic peptidase domain-containing protein [Armillaria novae-zelandiae]|uniref:Aspartic peptidase domain-containing protein n=1 Tax=Armillaria novae-zelandiae TaxID=153914 RepID=A0AA39NZW3_9AGAR|nr:aspartic peptidase domain-containing protein [Armillaria novae-zelandiae]